MSRVTGTTIQRLLNKGQTEKVTSLFLRYAKSNDFIVYNLTKSDREKMGKFPGAYVLEPLIGYYGPEKPIVVMDFASLYPSIMIAWNMCYTTILSQEQKLKFDGMGMGEGIGYMRAHTEPPIYFVKKEIMEGLLPMMLKKLLDERKVEKTKMKEAKKAGNFLKELLANGRQLALKESANSTYGYTGFPKGKNPNTLIAYAITACGQYLTRETKKIVQNTINIENGYEYNSVCVYGDTDSVMVSFHNDIDESIKIAKEACKICNKKFPNPVDLQYEQVYCPYNLQRKKMYQGCRYFKSSKENPTLVKKGDVLKRRDKPGITKRCVSEINDVQMRIVDYGDKTTDEIRIRCEGIARKYLKKLLDGDVKYSDFIIKKSITKNVMEYENPVKREVYSKLEKVKEMDWDDEKVGISRSEFLDVCNKLGRKRKQEEENELVKKIMYTSIFMDVYKRYGRSMLALAIVYVLKKSRDGTSYIPKKRRAGLQPHVALTMKMAKNKPGCEPKQGDRVAYVIVKGGRKQKICERVSDPQSVFIEKKHEIDTNYYINNLITEVSKKMYPITIDFSKKINSMDFDSMKSDEIKGFYDKLVKEAEKETKERIFGGMQTKKIDGVRKSIMGNLSKHFTIVPKCVGCGGRIANNEACEERSRKVRRVHGTNCSVKAGTQKYMCNCCKGNVEKIFSRFISKYNKLRKYSEILKLQCMFCQQERYGKVPCSNDDCEHFYSRYQYSNDIEEVESKIRKLGISNGVNNYSICNIIKEFN